MGRLTIRSVTGEDASPLAALMRQLGYPTTESEMKARLRRILRRPDYRTLVAVDGSAVVGLIGGTVAPSYEHNEPVGRIIALVVDAASRRKGAGWRLVRQLEAWFRGRGVRRAMVNAAVPRADAHRFYRAVGFEHTGLRFTKRFDLTSGRPIRKKRGKGVTIDK